MDRKTWQDLYYDGELDEKFEGFDEDTQKIIDFERSDGWDDPEELYIEEYKNLWDDKQEVD